MEDRQLIEIAQRRRRQRPKPRNAVPLTQTLNGIMRNRIVPLYNKVGPVAQAWNELMPPKIREQCRLDAVQNGTLIVIAASAAYAAEIRMSKIQIIDQLTAMCPRAGLKNIKVTVGQNRKRY